VFHHINICLGWDIQLLQRSFGVTNTRSGKKSALREVAIACIPGA
jgi:hypothetical protein